MALYQHPNIREMSASALHEIIEQRRNQRLVTAIEVDNARKRNLTRMSKKDMETYEKLGDRCATRLAKIRQMLEMCDDDVLKMNKLSNNLRLVEQELGTEFVQNAQDNPEPEPELEISGDTDD